jgi:hypothetical protein
MNMQPVILGADHAGYDLKEAVKAILAKGNIPVTDAGTNGPESVDYPDFARPVAEAVAAGRFPRGSSSAAPVSAWPLPPTGIPCPGGPVSGRGDGPPEPPP